MHKYILVYASEYFYPYSIMIATNDVTRASSGSVVTVVF